ncbi:HAD family hydrolase [Fictibacillus phosphorivorans]|uniref:HAD family hydrolase n=1 Tax=Fictibacillus phosphorivorans TaxID=1221500 RepID=UPI0020413861|nr:HAD family hydrolase [Fictibacillus phosphorivorans]MCM3717579.1 HAD family hydrolase [Fictibacillus phosphorivorans]MCM3775274.1 HAD family hydrolase [Fictibacillus phosphorivorans]
MIKALVFDFDGTILDTETQHYYAFQEMFNEHGSELPLEVWGQYIGTHSKFNPYEYLEKQINKKLNHDELRTKKTERALALIKEQKPLPGIENYLRAAKELGLKIGLASSSSRKWVIEHLERIGLAHYFEVIKTADDVEMVKPDPSLYTKTIKELGVKPEEAIAFEDSVNGSIAAKKAGLYCVVIPNPVTKHMQFDEVDHQMESIAELELEALIQLTEQRTS